MSRFKAVVFDIDGTLTDQVSWTAFTRDLGGSVDDHQALFDDFRNQKIGYGEAKGRLLELWQQTGNANWDHIQRMFGNWPVKKEARQVIDSIKRLGLEICLISGSVDFYAQHIAERLGISEWYANSRLHFDHSGKLIDFEYNLDQAGKKMEQFEEYLEKHSFSSRDCVTVGDSDNDIGLFRATGNGILINSEGVAHNLKEASWKTVDSLSEIPDLLA